MINEVPTIHFIVHTVVSVKYYIYSIYVRRSHSDRSVYTGGCIKTPTGFTIIYEFMIYFDLHDMNTHDRCGFHHVLIKIE